MDCTENQYSFNKGCHLCLQCEPGQELSEDCGYGNGLSSYCTPCSLKTYKAEWGHHNCRFCQSCKHLNRHEKSSCTARRNAVCGECLPGFHSKIRIDGLQDLECLPCGPASPAGQQCRRSRGVGVEKESVLGIFPQNQTAADTVSVVLVTMAITLSVVLLIYFRQTVLRKLSKGCLAFKGRSQTDIESAACRVSRVTMNPNQEEQIPGYNGTHGDEFDLLESVTISPQPSPQDCGQNPDIQPLDPDATASYQSSGFESLTSSEQPFNSQEVAVPTQAPSSWQPCGIQEVAVATSAPSSRQPSDIQEIAVATPAPSSWQPCDIQEVAVATLAPLEFAGRSTFQLFQTAQGHCASEQENYQHIPVECTEMDIHRAVTSSLVHLYCQMQPHCSYGLMGAEAGAEAGTEAGAGTEARVEALDSSVHSNVLRDQSWSPTACTEKPLDC